MIKTATLQLPIYNTPDVDTFNLTDINTAHTNIEAFANTIMLSGTTSNRPVPTFIGQPYFDITLGKQINAKTLSPVVWVDGIGTVC